MPCDTLEKHNCALRLQEHDSHPSEDWDDVANVLHGLSTSWSERNVTSSSLQVIGLLLVILLTLIAAILSCIPFGKCCSSDWPEAVLEEAGLVVSQKIRMAVREKLRAKLDQSGPNRREWEGLERELLIGPKPDETQQVQENVFVNSVPLRPISRQGSDMDWGRARPGLNHNQVTSNQWRK